jgi:hypothetical protein
MESVRWRLNTAFDVAIDWVVALFIAAGWAFGAWVAVFSVLSLPLPVSAGWAFAPLVLLGPLAGRIHRSWRIAGLATALAAGSFAGFWALLQRPMFWGL